MSIDRLTLRRPDDWHVHLRDGAMLSRVANYTARQFARAIVMPNLKVPVTTVADGRAYRDRIRAAVDPGLAFEPLMTAYLTDASDPAELARGHAEGLFTAAKLYPANATTNSAAGVTEIWHLTPVFETLQRIGMPLLLHGEVTDADIDIFDREAVFVERVLRRLVGDFPALKVVLEHVTTTDAVDFVLSAPDTVAATITPHHLEHSRNAMFAGGIRPHLYCLPILKREHHRQSLRRAATSGNPKFFLGTDSAPHADRHQGSCVWLRWSIQRRPRARKLRQGVRRSQCARQARRFRVAVRAALLRLARQRRVGDPRTPRHSSPRSHRPARPLPRRRNPRVAARGLANRLISRSNILVIGGFHGQRSTRRHLARSS